MRIDRLQATNLRCFQTLDFAPGGGLNWLVGPNGAGKTTVLEAAHILSHGRSFRSGGRGAPCRHGAHEYVVHASLTRGVRSGIRLGLARREGRWHGRLDGADLGSLAPLFEACPTVCFGPESQTLATGPAEGRRSFMDWNVFHVEHTSLALWRDWRRALRQRNALLRDAAPDRAFEPWEHDLAGLAGRIHAARSACLKSLAPYVTEEAAWLVPELGDVRLEYRPGWDVVGGLEPQLAAHRERDRDRGFTRYGAHRADWWLRFGRLTQNEYLSRGQAKAAALVCALAQVRWLHDETGEFPLLCLDDLASELDRAHALKVVTWLAGKSVQVWLTATALPDWWLGGTTDRVFHVKPSGVTSAPVGRA